MAEAIDAIGRLPFQFWVVAAMGVVGMTIAVVSFIERKKP